jgi:large subunit ribosomal protein LP1
MIKAAGITVEPYWPSLFAKLLEKTNMDDLISSIGSAPAPGAGGVPAAEGSSAAAVEETKKEESESEEEDGADFDLFD